MVTLLLITTSCGGKSAPPEQPGDVTLRQSARAAGLAYSLDHPEEAIAQYQRALERARARDDVDAIGDNGYNLAVVQLAANQSRQALATTRMTRAELARRGAGTFFALDLAEATALYRLGEKHAADSLAARAEAGTDPAASARASFLRGLIADEMGDTVGLEQALARLAQPTSDDQRADADELQARRHLRQHAFAAAVTNALRASDTRRNLVDYRGMARALSVAAAAELDAGDARGAAELYLRAGQSAAAQGDSASARIWLRQTVQLEGDGPSRAAAQSALASLNSTSATSATKPHMKRSRDTRPQLSARPTACAMRFAPITSPRTATKI